MSRRPRRLPLFAGAMVLALGIGGTAGYAAWTTNTTGTVTVGGATTATTLTGVPSLAVTYKPGVTGLVAATLVQTAPVTIANTGTAPLAYTMSVAGGTAALNAAITVQVWPSGGTCTNATTVPGTATSGTLAALPALPTGATSAAAGASIALCIRTSMTSANVLAQAGLTTAPTITVTGKVGDNWTTTAAGSVTQSAANHRFRITNVGSGKCLDVSGGTASIGAGVVINTCAAGNRQTWLFTPTTDTAGFFFLQNATNTATVLRGGTVLADAAMHPPASLISALLTARVERWQPVAHGTTGHFRLVNNAGDCMVTRSTTDNSTITYASVCATSTDPTNADYKAQHFTFTEL